MCIRSELLAKRSGKHAWAFVFLLPLSLLSSTTPVAQTTQSTRPSDTLHQLNDSVEALVRRVSPSVVQIQVTGYGVADDRNPKLASDVIGRRQSIGSGVIVDPEGYIVTNAHVVKGAESIDVIVPPLLAPSSALDPALGSQGKSYQARIIGVAPEIDLAVIKIDAHGLPPLPVRASHPSARQGALVFAFGSPEGLRNTVTMGVVSAVARQPDPDSPLVYVQTDTPINPGNSGGPLVDVDGELVGINTFILTTSGGNQGLGFAIPAGVVATAYPQLLKFGHIHQPTMGALVQTITPELAAALHLSRDFGVIVSDVISGGPADGAGLRIQDIIVSVDGLSTGGLPMFAHSLNLHHGGDTVKVEVMRGSDRLQLDILLMERPHKEDSLADSVDPVKNLVRPLNIVGVELTLELARNLPDLRIPTGVIVAARTAGSRTAEVPLQSGDVIHGINGVTVTTLKGLREELAKLKSGDAIALQIERFGQIFYVPFSR